MSNHPKGLIGFLLVGVCLAGVVYVVQPSPDSEDLVVVKCGSDPTEETKENRIFSFEVSAKSGGSSIALKPEIKNTLEKANKFLAVTTNSTVQQKLSELNAWAFLECEKVVRRGSKSDEVDRYNTMYSEGLDTFYEAILGFATKAEAPEKVKNKESAALHEIAAPPRENESAAIASQPEVASPEEAESAPWYIRPVNDVHCQLGHETNGQQPPFLIARGPATVVVRGVRGSGNVFPIAQAYERLTERQILDKGLALDFDPLYENSTKEFTAPMGSTLRYRSSFPSTISISGAEGEPLDCRAVCVIVTPDTKDTCPACPGGSCMAPKTAQ